MTQHIVLCSTGIVLGTISDGERLLRKFTGKVPPHMDFISGSTIVSRSVQQFRPGSKTHGDGAEIDAVDESSRSQLESYDDSQLVAVCLQENPAAFGVLVNRYREKMLRLIVSILGRQEETEDIAQDIFVKIYLSLPRFRGDSSFSTYLYTVTVNRCRDELRKNRLRRFFSFDDWFAKGEINGPVEENGQQLDSNERQVAVRRALKRMPPQTQMLLHLREIEELNYKELANIFNVEIGTIKSRLARGRERLREELLPYMQDGTMPDEMISPE